MSKKTISVSISDRNGNMGTNTVGFNFETAEELDQNIEKYIKEDLNLTRVDVLIEDYDSILSTEDVDYLEELNYEVN